MAILKSDAAEDIINNYSYSKNYVSGHSLGGSMAADYASKNSDSVDGVVLFASYSTENISDLKVLSIYGSEDKVLNMESYDKYKSNLGNFTEIIIKGGNHAQFGEYGFQRGDGSGIISGEKQRNESVEAVISFV